MMCLEGTRKQSKIAVSAIAAIMGSSSDESTVSELCKVKSNTIMPKAFAFFFEICSATLMHS